jgi:plasmid stability protein
LGGRLFRARAKKVGRSLEAELRQFLTEAARQWRESYLESLNAFTEDLRDKYGEMPDSMPLIREIRDRDLG